MKTLSDLINNCSPSEQERLDEACRMTAVAMATNANTGGAAEQVAFLLHSGLTKNEIFEAVAPPPAADPPPVSAAYVERGPQQPAGLDRPIKQLVEALKAAESHLDFTGYGDSYEREGAMASKLPDRIEAALRAGRLCLSRIDRRGEVAPAVSAKPPKRKRFDREERIDDICDHICHKCDVQDVDERTGKELAIEAMEQMIAAYKRRLEEISEDDMD